MKRPVTKDSVFRVEPYRSILRLLSIFQKHKGGMEQKQFRYALIRNHDIRTPQNKEGLDKWAIAECEGFFGKTIEFFIKNNLIKEGCVSSRNNLNGFLNRLLDLEVIERNDKSRYRFSINYFTLFERIRCENTLNLYETNEIVAIDFKEKINHMLFGFSDELTDFESSEDIQYLSDSLKSIENTLEGIESLRNKLVLRFYSKRAKKLVTNYGNDKFKSLFTHPYMLVDFFQNWYNPDDTRFMDLVESATEKDIDIINVSKVWNDFLLTYGYLMEVESRDENILKEKWGLSREDYWKIDNLIRKEMENIAEMLCSISYVYYPRFGKNLVEKNIDEILQVLNGSG
jgi:hypothetical protein